MIGKIFYEILGNDLTMKYIGLSNILEQVKSYVENQSNIDYCDNSGNYAVVLKAENKIIGQFTLEINPKHFKASISYLFNSNYWNKGYAIECAKFMVDYTFNEINLNRVEADCIEENLSSIKIFKKLNMK
ncbi:MAG: GNAT family N-acetyltransferase, partial [Bacilli bacterium]|nr:GNAT family N-acetyltransferase [Bacilli bacterium]